MSGRVFRIRRVIALLSSVVVIAVLLFTNEDLWQPVQPQVLTINNSKAKLALDALALLEVKGRAPKTGYERTQFGNGWTLINGCDTRNIILHRDLTNVAVADGCKVASGILDDPYTGVKIEFKRGSSTSDKVQIDHVVALSNAWQTGAQLLNKEIREALANDPLELLAVDGLANQEKSDGDAATWLPPNKTFRCQYVARQIAVKAKYGLWVTPPEKDAMARVLAVCPGQTLPFEEINKGREDDVH